MLRKIDVLIMLILGLLLLSGFMINSDKDSDIKCEVTDGYTNNSYIVRCILNKNDYKVANKKVDNGETDEEGNEDNYGDSYRNNDNYNKYGEDGEYSDYEEKYDRIIDELNINEIEGKLKRKQILKRTSLRQIIKVVASGDNKEIRRIFKQEFSNAFIVELSSIKSVLIQMITIVLLGSIFVNLSTNIGGGFVSENGFFITYMISTSILLSIFSISTDIAIRSLDHIIDVVKIIIPVYALSMNYIGQRVTASGMYEIIFVAIALIQLLIKKIIIPMIKYYVLISLVNYINKEDKFSKMSQLLKKTATWLLKTLVVFVIGINIVKNLINPQIDSLGREAIKKVVSTIPGGSMISILSGAFLGAGMLIKNSIGVTAMLIIVGILIMPILKLLLIGIMVRLTMVMIQPLGEKRYVNGIESVVNGLSLLIHSVASSAALFLITIALMAFSGRS